ncbi:lipoxygenase [Hypoxylon sp. FL1150]|nr:lipoxygenase [Hypoxylon sp. FL1150]
MNRAMKLVDWSHKKFHFQGKHVLRDLKNRGFDLKQEAKDKYCNHKYVSNTLLLWNVIRSFVKSMFETKYKYDEQVKANSCISDRCLEIPEKGQIPTFTTITTLDQLIDAVTMCIHTASPQHTAVNYLQDYYYSFILAKPAALCTPIPTDLKALRAFTEEDLTAAFLIGTDPENSKWKD